MKWFSWLILIIILFSIWSINSKINDLQTNLRDLQYNANNPPIYSCSGTIDGNIVELNCDPKQQKSFLDKYK